MKECSKCGEVKSLEEFELVIDTRRKSCTPHTYYKDKCISCIRQYTAEFKRNQRAEKNKIINIQYLTDNQKYIKEILDYDVTELINNFVPVKFKELKKKIKNIENKPREAEYQKEYREQNKEKLKEQKAEYYKENIEKFKESKKQHYIKNREAILEQKKDYARRNRAKIQAKANIRQKERYHTEPAFRIRQLISGRIRREIKDQGSIKLGSILESLPYSMVELKQHLESQFESWMNWDNYGPYIAEDWDDNDQSSWTWNIDHIIPHSALPYDSMKHPNFIKCWELNNLRPLLSKTNVLKSDRLIDIAS